MELPNGVKIESSRVVTPKFVTKEALSIWLKVVSVVKTVGESYLGEKALQQMREEHPEFSESYPLVLRLICEMMAFSAPALYKWLCRIEKRPWTTELEYLEAQADYVEILAVHRGSTPADAAKMREITHRRLLDEHQSFKESYERVTAAINERDTADKRDAVEAFKDFVAAGGLDIEGGMRAEVDHRAAIGGEPVVAAAPAVFDGAIGASDILLG